MRAKRPMPGSFHSGLVVTSTPRLAQFVEKLVQALDAQVQHELAIGREVIGVRRERREDGGAGLLFPHAPVVAADAEMVAIPALQRVGVLRPEEESANSGDPHHLPPQEMGRRALSACASVPSSR